MKRSEFFSEMKRGLFETVKEVSSPIIHEDLEKIDDFIDGVAHIQWHEVGQSDLILNKGVHDYFVGGRAITLVNLQEQPLAFDKACPYCRMMVQWIAYDHKFTCFQCEKSYFVKKHEGELALLNIPLKTVEGRLYFGLKKQ